MKAKVARPFWMAMHLYFSLYWVVVLWFVNVVLMAACNLFVELLCVM